MTTAIPLEINIGTKKLKDFPAPVAMIFRTSLPFSAASITLYYPSLKLLYPHPICITVLAVSSLGGTELLFELTAIPSLRFVGFIII